MQIYIEVTPLAGVWIEIKQDTGSHADTKSHPSRVCGLKSETHPNPDTSIKSHPSRVCRLKSLIRGNREREITPHPHVHLGISSTGTRTETFFCARYRYRREKIMTMRAPLPNELL